MRRNIKPADVVIPMDGVVKVPASAFAKAGEAGDHHGRAGCSKPGGLTACHVPASIRFS